MLELSDWGARILRAAFRILRGACGMRRQDAGYSTLEACAPGFARDGRAPHGRKTSAIAHRNNGIRRMFGAGSTTETKWSIARAP